MQVQPIQNQQNFTGKVHNINISSPSKQMNLAIKHLNASNKIKNSEANIYLFDTYDQTPPETIYVFAKKGPLDYNRRRSYWFYKILSNGEKAKPNNRDSIVEAAKRSLKKVPQIEHRERLEHLKEELKNEMRKRSEASITQKIKNFIKNIFN